MLKNNFKNQNKKLSLIEDNFFYRNSFALSVIKYFYNKIIDYKRNVIYY